MAHTPAPDGLPSGLAGRVEHMRGHALAYFTEEGSRSPQGQFLWKMADVLAQEDE